MVDKGSDVEPSLGLVSSPFPVDHHEVSQDDWQGRPMSPVATPWRVGVRWDGPLPIRGHLDGSLRGERTPGPVLRGFPPGLCGDGCGDG